MGRLWRDGHDGFNYNLFALFEEGEQGAAEHEDQPQASLEDRQHALLVRQLSGVLQRCADATETLQEYQGCGTLMRQLISTPDDEELYRATTRVLLPNVEAIRNFYALSLDVAQATPALLRKLAELNTILERPVLACKFTELLQAVLAWDQLKMMKPQVQNDLASYRRLLPRMERDREQGSLPPLPIAGTDATTISMFIAENVPLMVVLAKVTSDTARVTPQVAKVIATVANMCCGMVQRQVHRSEAMNRKLLTGMVSAVVLYDRITDAGVFVKKSGVEVSRCIKLINKHGGTIGEQLRATLRYTTMHYNSATTPRSIRNALAN